VATERTTADHLTSNRLTREESLARADEMARLRNDEKLTLKAIGDRYGITRQCVHQVLQRRAERLRRTTRLEPPARFSR
jgi:DNA-directed RNA polymerase sigma subunit (sigma70/sigma32)